MVCVCVCVWGRGGGINIWWGDSPVRGFLKVSQRLRWGNEQVLLVGGLLQLPEHFIFRKPSVLHTKSSFSLGHLLYMGGNPLAAYL